MIDKNKILLIAGSGQNVGKTTLVCNIIKQNLDKNIIGIKISPHFHNVENCETIIKTDSFEIYIEKNTDGIKDSSKMLLTGAKQVFYVQAKDDALNSAYKKISELISNNSFVVCESGGLRNILKPQIFLFIKSIDENQIKEKSKHLMSLADGVLIFNGKKHIWQKKLEISFPLKIL